MQRLKALDVQLSAALARVDLSRTLAYVEDVLAAKKKGRAVDMPTSTRLPQELIERLDDLAERMGNDPQAAALTGGAVSRAAALRTVVIAGLEALEARYPKTRRSKG